MVCGGGGGGGGGGQARQLGLHCLCVRVVSVVCVLLWEGANGISMGHDLD
jgi:hypothetical protein